MLAHALEVCATWQAVAAKVGTRTAIACESAADRRGWRKVNNAPNARGRCPALQWEPGPWQLPDDYGERVNDAIHAAVARRRTTLSLACVRGGMSRHAGRHWAEGLPTLDSFLLLCKGLGTHPADVLREAFDD